MELYLGDGVIFWECLLFGVSTFDFLYLDMYLDMCFILWTYVLCGMCLVLCFDVGMNLCACMDICLICIYIHLYLCSYVWCMWYMCCVSSSFTIHPSTTCYWRLEVIRTVGG